MGAANVVLYAQWTLIPTYTVTYSGNGSTGGSPPTDSNQYQQGQTVTVLGNSGSLSRTGYVFANWNTLANGSGTSYLMGNTFAMGTANVTLYAQWTPTYTVTYDGSGNTGGSVPVDSNQYKQGQTVTVVGPGSLVKSGYAFKAWNTMANGTGTSYSTGNTFSMPAANLTLYAQWIAVYTVTYNGNGNTGGSVPVDNNQYAQNQTVTVLGNTGNLVKSGYTFVGWNTAGNYGGTLYTGGNTFPMGTASLTLWAQWTCTAVSCVSGTCDCGDSSCDPNRMVCGSSCGPCKYSTDGGATCSGVIAAGSQGGCGSNAVCSSGQVCLLKNSNNCSFNSDCYSGTCDCWSDNGGGTCNGFVCGPDCGPCGILYNSPTGSCLGSGFGPNDGTTTPSCNSSGGACGASSCACGTNPGPGTCQLGIGAVCTNSGQCASQHCVCPCSNPGCSASGVCNSSSSCL